MAQNFPHAWLWNDHVLADVSLQVYAAGADLQHGKPQPVAKRPLHAQVLASFSGHYRNQLLRLWQSPIPGAPAQDREPAPPATRDEDDGASENDAEREPPLAQATQQTQTSSGAHSPKSQGPQVLSAVKSWLGKSAMSGLAVVSRIADAGGASKGKKRLADEELPGSKRRRTGTGAGHVTCGQDEQGTKVLELVCHAGEPHDVPESVMEHAYTGKLPDSPTMLAWMLWRADSLDVKTTVAACLDKLVAQSEAGELSVLDVVLLSSLPALQPHSQASVQAAVTSMAARALPKHLGATRTVLSDPDLLAQFVQLPFPLLRQWATLPGLHVDSENTLAVLFTAWYDHQVDVGPSPPSEAQCRELSSFLCLNRLTHSFHCQVLPHLRWYRVPDGLPEQHALVRLLAAIDPAVQDTEFEEQMDACISTRPSAPSTRQQQWPLPRDQITNLWEEGVMELSTAYFAGYMIQPILETELVRAARATPTGGQDSSNGAEKFTLGLSVRPHWPEVLVKHGVADKVKNPATALKLSVKVGGAATKSVRVTCTADQPRGWFDVLNRSFATALELHTALAKGIDLTFAEAR